ncbi:hypothetical protein CEUSTIGMA_g9805.t1 [Chlamydomonas eustigma]|uniref:Cilium assembly protein DZIP1 N-terminal domain-containing protein n=1 Tax=Chlamydomonas eustigma TaxID=1157962 RepID=A0A250XH24_9CHLO|nr:hypothetical protein CEUSTIGMA_g9805.t1 [Chlamydomonas eustigma]|eukprot:GAX82377.1 hypothetical protein CEUSTIGMA_g9805.t1 [Chlamydomonas eustigma]
MTSFFPKHSTITLGRSMNGFVDLDFASRDQNVTLNAAPTFPAFKFESRRARIDWRLLHGVDINPIIRDVDLDTLEKVTSIIAFGDVEAEDTRYLTEMNFIKIFRLAQLTIEYLLYVQDCLQTTNTWLQLDRGNMERYCQAIRLRLRELDSHLKMNKKELRRARKTVKTYETMVSLGKVKGMNADAETLGHVGLHMTNNQQQSTSATALALESMMKRELAVMGERLSRAQAEAQELKVEREELFSQLKEVEVILQATAGPGGSMTAVSTIRSLQDQLNKANSDLKTAWREKVELQNQVDVLTIDNRLLLGRKQQQQQVPNEMMGAVELSRSSRQSSAVGSVAAEGTRTDFSPSASDPTVLSLLRTAEEDRRKLEGSLVESQAEVDALRRQLMKVMRDAASRPDDLKPAVIIGSQSEIALHASEASRRELEKRMSDMERDLTSRKKAQHDLEDELELTRQSAADSQRKLALTRQQLQEVTFALEAARQQQTKQPVGGLVKMDDQESQLAVLAELRSNKERLQQQVVQLQADNASLKAQLSEANLAVLQASQKSRLQDQALEDAQRQLEQLKKAWRDLQSQLRDEAEASRRTGSSAPFESGTVKEKIQDFERLADQSNASLNAAQLVSQPPSPEVKQLLERSGELKDSGSFKFTPPPAAASALRPDTPSGVTPPGGGGTTYVPLLATPAKPSEDEIRRLRAEVMARVTDRTPEQLSLLIEEELRVITENPYEYEDEDEQHFQSMLPYEMRGRPGVRSVEYHDNAVILEDTLQRLGPLIFDTLDAQIASFGMDSSKQVLSDKEYAAAMLVLEERRQRMLDLIPPERRDQAVFLRDALLTHLELMKRHYAPPAISSTAATTAAGHLAGTTWSSAAPGLSPMQQQQQLPSSSQQASDGVFGIRGDASGAYRLQGQYSNQEGVSAVSQLSRQPAFVSPSLTNSPLRIPEASYSSSIPQYNSHDIPAQQQISTTTPQSPTRAGSRVSAASGQLPPSPTGPSSPLNQSIGRYGGVGGTGTSLNASLNRSMRTSVTAVSALDQSLKRQAAQAAPLNQSLNRSRTGTTPTVLSPTGGSGGTRVVSGQSNVQAGGVAGGGVSPLNMSIRSTGSPSRLDYSSRQNESSSDDYNDNSFADNGRRREGNDSRRAGDGLRSERSVQEMSDVDSDVMDYGISGDPMMMPKIIAAGRAINAGGLGGEPRQQQQQQLSQQHNRGNNNIADSYKGPSAVPASNQQRPSTSGREVRKSWTDAPLPVQIPQPSVQQAHNAAFATSQQTGQLAVGSPATAGTGTEVAMSEGSIHSFHLSETMDSTRGSNSPFNARIRIQQKQAATVAAALNSSGGLLVDPASLLPPPPGKSTWTTVSPDATLRGAGMTRLGVSSASPPQLTSTASANTSNYIWLNTEGPADDVEAFNTTVDKFDATTSSAGTASWRAPRVGGGVLLGTTSSSVRAQDSAPAVSMKARIGNIISRQDSLESVSDIDWQD